MIKLSKDVLDSLRQGAANSTDPHGEYGWDFSSYEVAALLAAYDAQAATLEGAPYPPVVQAILKACDAVLLDASGPNLRLVAEGPEALALAKAIGHWRASTAGGLL